MGKGNKYKVKEHQLYCVKPSVWKQLIKENDIDQMYVKRANFISFFSSVSAPLQRIQRWIYRKKLKSIDVNKQPPIFILGHWRSGTTHLHYILARDKQFGILSNYQNFLFNVSLLNKSWLKRLLSALMPKTRPQDNIEIDAYKPAEEEQPLSAMSTRSGFHSWYFPKNQTYFEKYNLFKNISPEEKKAWQCDYVECLQHISWSNKQKRLLLKNPHNTSRVKELLELFPNAKFVTIHRDPIDVFMSTRHLYHRMLSTQFLQFMSLSEIDDLIINNYKSTMAKYNREKSLIPEGNLVEIDYENIIEDPLKEVEGIYRGLNINGYENALPSIKKYLASVKGFERNKFQDTSHSDAIAEALNSKPRLEPVN